MGNYLAKSKCLPHVWASWPKYSKLPQTAAVRPSLRKLRHLDVFATETWILRARRSVCVHYSSFIWQWNLHIDTCFLRKSIVNLVKLDVYRNCQNLSTEQDSVMEPLRRFNYFQQRSIFYHVVFDVCILHQWRKTGELWRVLRWPLETREVWPQYRQKMAY